MTIYIRMFFISLAAPEVEASEDDVSIGKGAFQFIVFSKKPCLINSEQNPTSSINPFYFTSQPLHLTCNR